MTEKRLEGKWLGVRNSGLLKITDFETVRFNCIRYLKRYHNLISPWSSTSSQGLSLQGAGRRGGTLGTRLLGHVQ